MVYKSRNFTYRPGNFRAVHSQKPVIDVYSWKYTLFFRFLHQVKRTWLHIIFWILYCVQDIVLQFIYAKPYLQGIPVTKQLLICAESEIILLPFKLAVTYFALYVFLKSVMNEKRHVIVPILWMLFVLAINVVLYRMVDYYWVTPLLALTSNKRPDVFTFSNLWIILFDIGPVAVIALIIKFVRIQFRNREKERILMKEKLETELKFLRNQINPHFLFKTLDNIHTLTAQKSNDAPEVIMQLSKLLNFMLYESRKKMISIADEMKILDDYVELERTLNDSTLEIDFFREIDNEQEQVAPALLLSFAENAFRHGAAESYMVSNILIDIKLQSSVLNFNIEHTKGDGDALRHDDINGLFNAKRQIELSYSDYHLNVEDEKDFFKINLAINLKSYARI